MSSKTAIVTGASSGIGLAIARRLLEAGYYVVANSRSISTAQALQPTSHCFLVDGDVSQKTTGEKLTEVALAQTGRIDLVVNNAGIFVPGNFHEHTETQYRSILGTNLDGFFYVTQPAVRHMLDAKNGHVVTISSTLAVQPVAGLNAFGTYLSKSALNGVTKSLAIEYAAQGIRFNAIGAGIIDTPMHATENHSHLKGLHPIARLGTVEEIADAVDYLEKATFVTGEVIHVDGGAHAGKW